MKNKILGFYQVQLPKEEKKEQEYLYCIIEDIDGVKVPQYTEDYSQAKEWVQRYYDEHEYKERKESLKNDPNFVLAIPEEDFRKEVKDKYQLDVEKSYQDAFYNERGYLEYIKGTSVPRPRNRKVGETDKEYETFLENYYKKAQEANLFKTKPITKESKKVLKESKEEKTPVQKNPAPVKRKLFSKGKKKEKMPTKKLIQRIAIAGAAIFGATMALYIITKPKLTLQSRLGTAYFNTEKDKDNTTPTPTPTQTPTETVTPTPTEAPVETVTQPETQEVVETSYTQTNSGSQGGNSYSGGNNGSTSNNPIYADPSNPSGGNQGGTTEQPSLSEEEQNELDQILDEMNNTGTIPDNPKLDIDDEHVVTDENGNQHLDGSVSGDITTDPTDGVSNDEPLPDPGVIAGEETPTEDGDYNIIAGEEENYNPDEWDDVELVGNTETDSLDEVPPVPEENTQEETTEVIEEVPTEQDTDTISEENNYTQEEALTATDTVVEEVPTEQVSNATDIEKAAEQAVEAMANGEDGNIVFNKETGEISFTPSATVEQSTTITK